MYERHSSAAARRPHDGQPPPYHHHNSHSGKPQFSPHYSDRPPNPPFVRPNFVIQLRSDGSCIPEKHEIEALFRTLRFPPQESNILGPKLVVGSLFYQQWGDALGAMVQLWGIKLNDNMERGLLPRLICHVKVPSDKEELDSRLRVLFVEKLKGLMEGDLVMKCMEELGNVEGEIKKVSNLLRKKNRLGALDELLSRKRRLEAERGLIRKRVQEFESAIRCVVNYLEDGVKEEGSRVQVFRFSEKEVHWERIYHLMVRECRRLCDGLPIYAHRWDILKQIHCQQITVLIGETGSGKSTQLVQYLADSGIFGHESIVCSQPRKLAAISLVDRVKEESCGCYRDTPAICCYPSYSSDQDFDSKVIFMTDHCLMQHYMRDKELSMISCIIVDEAHERSLNTDLLLSVIKKLLCRRPRLRLIIMSATANAQQFSDYFFGCKDFHVAGRSYPVEIRYSPCDSEGITGSGFIAPYALAVLRTVMEIHKTKEEGTILAFLTSQMEVEWACEKLKASNAVVLPLHGKLAYEDQHRVFLNYPGQRKVIFTTNIAETSLTIPGVRYVVDCGMVKESRFEAASGMNVLRVCRISQSSANQRAGRAGRTEPGMCYRLYSENDFESMTPHQEPEIRMVHLDVAVLRILALGIKSVRHFDFVDAPSSAAIDMAVRNLIQLGAVAARDDSYELTPEGLELVRLGVEPRLGIIILKCFRHNLGKEGLALAAVMANSSSIFCRVGSEDDKLKSDCRKVQFCHPNGDLFTLLAVYKEWDEMSQEKKNRWCWENSINAKSMRRCQDTLQELEACLKSELNIIIPSYWRWHPQALTKHDETLKRVILFSCPENVAMYSGYDHLGYRVAVTGKHVQLHPSCSLLNFGERPTWVVFGEILSTSSEYLVCVTACDFKALSTLHPAPHFDFFEMDSQKLQKRILSGFGSLLLKRFCGKSNSNVHHLRSHVRASCMDERIGIDVNVNQNVILIYASTRDMEEVCRVVSDSLDYERKLSQNECVEKCLYNGGPAVIPPVALFGAGAEIKHLELEKRFLTIDIFHPNVDAINDRELLMFLERSTHGQICTICKFSGTGVDSEEKEKWGRVTFLTPDAARRAVDLNTFEFSGGLLKIVPCKITGGDHKMTAFCSLKANISWLRRHSRVAIVKCEPKDVPFMVNDFSDHLLIGGEHVLCVPSAKFMDSVVITRIHKDLSEEDIGEELKAATNRKILDFFIIRGDAVDNPPVVAVEETLRREILPFFRTRSSQANSVRVQVFQPEPKDRYMRATITFDGDLHLEAAKALDQIDGKVLPGFLSWQKIRCQQMFHSTLSCPPPVYAVIRSQLDSLLESFQKRKGVDCNLQRNQNGSYRVKISATGTKILAELRRPLEQLMKGKIIQHADITPVVVQLLFSREGIALVETIKRDTQTHIFFDRHNLIVRVFGTAANIVTAEQRLVKSLILLHDSKQLEVQLCGGALPPDMMKRVVQSFGPDLRGLKKKVPEAEFSLNARRHCISIVGMKEVKAKVEEIIYSVAQTGEQARRNGEDDVCPICLCEVEDGYRLGGCTHKFCRLCLVDQCESAIKSQDGFPLRCAHQGCGNLVWLCDLRLLLSNEKLEELFRAAMGAFVAGSGGAYRFCPSPDCPSIYRVAGPGKDGELFVCGACFQETCTGCHLEYHPYLSCEKYKEFKEDPDSSLKEWCIGKENVKTCPVCGFTIEKIDGCNHIECKCGKHVCWVCLAFFGSSDDCYGHLRSEHLAII